MQADDSHSSSGCNFKEKIARSCPTYSRLRLRVLPEFVNEGKQRDGGPINKLKVVLTVRRVIDRCLGSPNRLISSVSSLLTLTPFTLFLRTNHKWISVLVIGCRTFDTGD